MFKGIAPSRSLSYSSYLFSQANKLQIYFDSIHVTFFTRFIHDFFFSRCALIRCVGGNDALCTHIRFGMMKLQEEDAEDTFHQDKCIAIETQDNLICMQLEVEFKTPATNSMQISSK